MQLTRERAREIGRELAAVAAEYKTVKRIVGDLIETVNTDVAAMQASQAQLARRVSDLEAGIAALRGLSFWQRLRFALTRRI